LLSGKKVVVSTATRALEEQIFWKDLPLIERALGVPVRAALMKGISNYLCRRRLAEFRASESLCIPIRLESRAVRAGLWGPSDTWNDSERSRNPESFPAASRKSVH